MKKLFAILTALFALTVLSAAQTGGSSGSQGGSATGMQSEHHKGGGTTITGCLQGSQGAYTLKHGSKEIAVTSSEDLSAHVGHQVKLHGSWAGAGSSESGSTPSSTGEKGSKDRTFNATSIDHVSDTCSGSSESGEHHHHKGSDTGTSGTGQSTPPPKH